MTQKLLSEAEPLEGAPRPIASPPFWKHLLWGVVILTLIWFLSKIPSTLIVFSMAWLIAYLLNPLVGALCHRRIGPIKTCTRGQAVFIVASLLLGALTAAGSMILPQLSEQVNNLIHLQQSLGDPAAFSEVIQAKTKPWLAKVPDQYRQQVIDKATNLIQDSASQIGIWASQIIRSVGAFLGQLLSALFLVCSAFLVSLYMLLNWHNLAGGLLEKLPRQYQKEVLSLSLKLNEIFGGYLKATILTSLACTIATFVSLFLLCLFTGYDFPYKGVVAFVAGLSYPIPVIGIIATSILGGVLGFASPDHNLGFGVMVLVTINVVNILIDRTVQPRLMSGAIGVSELFVMFAAFAGGEVAGVWGMLLGIPVAAMGKTLFEWFHLNFLLVDELHSEETPILIKVKSPKPEPPTPEPKTVTPPPPFGAEAKIGVHSATTTVASHTLPPPSGAETKMPDAKPETTPGAPLLVPSQASATSPAVLVERDEDKSVPARAKFPTEVHAQTLKNPSTTNPLEEASTDSNKAVDAMPAGAATSNSAEGEKPSAPAKPKPSPKKRRKK